MYNAGFCADVTVDHKLPLENFAKRRDEVVAEVLRARERHFDNVVTSLEETLRQVSMVAFVLGAIRARALQRVVLSWFIGVLVAVAPAGALIWLFQNEVIDGDWFTASFVFGLSSSYALLFVGITTFFREYLRQFRKLQIAGLDDTFEDVYADFFIHNDGEDHRARWQVVKTKIVNILSSIHCASTLQPFPHFETARIEDVLQKDLWQLRQLARLIRIDLLPNQTGKEGGRVTSAAKQWGRSATAAGTM